jgi:hypothetical protein
MIVKKLAAPFINNKILHEAERCYIATAAISEAGFDFVRTRVSPKSRIEIVTGLDGLTSPMVLRRIWKHYRDRIDLRIYTRNFFHANVYIFDLPFRKGIAFTGSGSFTLEGLKDQEEIFHKTIDARDIEELKSWFTGYFEFAEPLHEALIDEYELVYPALKQREIASRQEKKQFIELTTGGFNWDTIKFKNQYFKKEDYITLGNSVASSLAEDIKAGRIAIQQKLLQLHDGIKQDLWALGLHANIDSRAIVSSPDPADHRDQKLRTMSIAYGQKESAMAWCVILRQKDLGVWGVLGKANENREDREHVQRSLQEPGYRSNLFKAIKGLGPHYWIEIAGETKLAEAFQTEDALIEFIKTDDWRYYDFTIGRNYAPGDAGISSENGARTILAEVNKQVVIYRLMRGQ